MSAEFECNIERVYDQFKKLSTQEMRRALRTGIRKGILMLRNQARKTFRSMFPSGAVRNVKYTDRLIDGIRATKVKEHNSEMVGYVLATSNRRMGSGSYRLVFLEGGTVDRQTRKGYNRGRITASYFFTSAIASNQLRYKSVVVNEIQKTIDKINQKNIH